MRPLRISLCNFMSHRSTDIDCTQFQSTLIVAANRNDSSESNGLGKTTIFLAIEYALFGKAPANLDKIVRDGCDRCEVSFDFEMGGGIYRVVRSRNRKTEKSEVFLFEKANDNWRDVSQKTPSQTEAELAKLIKISHVAFKHSVLFAQADLKGLSSGSAGDRKAILKEALQLAIYSKYEKIAKERVGVLQKELDKLRASRAFLGDPEFDIKTTNQMIETNQSQLVIAKEQIGKLEIDLAAKRISYAESDQRRSKSNVTDLINELTLLTKQKAGFQTMVSTISGSITVREEDLAKRSAELVNLKSQLDSAKTKHQNLIDNPLRSASDITADIEKMREKEIEGRAYTSRVSEDLTGLRQPMAEEDTCQRCKQQVTKDHRESCETQRLSDLTTKTENLAKAKQTLAAVQAKRAAFESELTQSRSRDSNILSLENSFTLLNSKIASSETLLGQITEGIAAHQRELKAIVEQRDTLAEKEIKLKADIAALDQKVLDAQVEALKLEIDVLTRNLNLLNKEMTNFNIAIGSLQERLSVAEGYLVEKTQVIQQIKEKEREFSIRLKVAQAVGPNGIPSLIISTILDDLQIVTNSSLADMRAGLEVRFSIIKTKGDGQQEDSLEVGFFINGKERDYDLISGGQKVMFAWAFKLALSVIIQHRIGVDIKFLELDEVDAMLDDAAKARYADIVKKWQDKFTIFVVTHNNALKDKFPQAILVESDGENGACGKLVSSW